MMSILLPFVVVVFVDDISFIFCIATSSSDSRLCLLETVSMSARRPLLLLLLLAGLICWSALIDTGIGLR